MTDQPSRPTPKQTLLLILLPLLGTVLSLRLYLHLVGVQHVYPGGYLVHHLFVGVLIELPAAFILAFGVRKRALAFLALGALGVGSGMILDEVTYLVATQASDRDYVSWVSLGWGDCVCYSGGDWVGGDLLVTAGMWMELASYNDVRMCGPRGPTGCGKGHLANSVAPSAANKAELKTKQLPQR